MSLVELNLPRSFPPETFLPIDIETRAKLRLGSLEDTHDIETAVQLIKEGHPVAGQMHGVFGLWVRADSQRAVKEALRIKGETGSRKPFASMMPSKDFLSLIDRKALLPKAQKLMEDAITLRKKVGAICHLRAPVRPDLIDTYQVPFSLISYQDKQLYMQNLDPFGHQSMSRFVRKLKDAVGYIGVTSLNDNTKGETEITQTKRAAEFCQEKGVPLLLTDPQHTREDVQGSFAIIDIEKLTAVRDGHVPVEMLEEILEVNFDKTKMKPGNYLPPTYPPLVEIDLIPELKRAVVILHLKGFQADEVKARIERTIQALGRRSKKTGSIARF